MNVEQIIKTSRPLPIETRTIIHLVLVNNKINETISVALKPFEVSIEQFNVLRILKGQKSQPANLSTINERMVTKMSNTTRLIDKLILKKFVNRVPCKTNRRKIEISITEEGKLALEKMSVAVTNSQNQLLESLSKEELNILNNLLDKF